MAAHSSTRASKIPWMEEPGGLQSMGSWRVGHDWATSLSLFTFMHWRRKWQPTPVFLPGESQGWGAWWAAIYRVAQSQTRLKRCSNRSSSRVMPRDSYVWNIEKWYRWTYLQNRNRVTDLENKRMNTKEGRGFGINCEALYHNKFNKKSPVKF